jgi:hypothetical protein
VNDDKLTVFQQWAPEDNQWSAWVKPVLFASLTNKDFSGVNISELPDCQYVSQLYRKSAIIIDLEGENSILEGLSLAQKGYFPVPLFNCCKAPGMLIDVSVLSKYLVAGGQFLKDNRVRYDASPIFILDSRRMNFSNIIKEGRFDNRWCLVPQDMPSGKHLKDAGFDNILVRTDRIRDDLSHILCRYQQAGIKVQICSDRSTVENITVRTPSYFRYLSYRWSVYLGLKRNSAGGFGAMVPEQATHSTGMG